MCNDDYNRTPEEAAHDFEQNDHDDYLEDLRIMEQIENADIPQALADDVGIGGDA